MCEVQAELQRLLENEGGKIIMTEEEMGEQLELLEDYDPLDNYCYECTGYGDDYYIDEDGDLICRCDKCIYNSSNNDWND